MEGGHLRGPKGTGRNINEGNEVPLGLAQHILDDLLRLVKKSKCIAVINLD